MSFSFTPMSEEEIQSMNLIPEGIYDFEVLKANQKVSKSGNEMIEMQLKVWDKEGKTHLIYDYLVSTQNMTYKIKHFCDTVGLEKEYLAGTFNVEACEGLDGKAHILIQNGQKNPAGGFYPNKNAVKDYVDNTCPNEKKEEKESSNNEQNLNDDIPF